MKKQWPKGKRRCNQCWRLKAEKRFEKPDTCSSTRGDANYYQDCSACRKARKSGYALVSTRRASIDAQPMRVLVVHESLNRKTGPMPVTYTSGRTCPTSCTLRENGCYAEYGIMRMTWQKLGDFGLRWKAFLDVVSTFEPGQIWRHNVAGDLPGTGDDIDEQALFALLDAAKHTRGFTYTHKPVLPLQDSDVVRAGHKTGRSDVLGVLLGVVHNRQANALIIKIANRQDGLTINLSTDSFEQADAAKALNIAPVVVTVPCDHPRFSRTPAGNPVIVCPAQVEDDITCAKCKLCTVKTRKSIVAFRAHGQGQKAINQRRQLPLFNPEKTK